MKLVDEKGKLFGKLNIVDLLVIIVIVAAAVLLAFKLLGGSGGVGAAVPQVTYTVRVMEVDLRQRASVCGQRLRQAGPANGQRAAAGWVYRGRDG